jgi:hypothetical protein
MADLSKIRRETIRWQIILTLNNARPVGAFERMVLSVIQAEYPDSTQNEVRRELDYLASRNLVELKKRPDGRWFAELSRYGVDVAEYTVDVEPGIARPEKYFDA